MLIMSVFRGDAGGKLDIGRAMSFVPQRPQAATTASPIEVRLKGVSRVKSSIVHLVGMPTGICTTSSTTLCANIDLEPLVKPCLQVHMPDCKHGGWSARLSHDWMLQGATHRLPLADTSSCHHSQLCMGMPWQSTRVEPEPSQALSCSKSLNCSFPHRRQLPRQVQLRCHLRWSHQCCPVSPSKCQSPSWSWATTRPARTRSPPSQCPAQTLPRSPSRAPGPLWIHSGTVQPSGLS